MHMLLLLATQKSFLLLDLDKGGKKYRLYLLWSQVHKTTLKRTDNCIHLFVSRYFRSSSQIVKRDENYKSLISKIVCILQILHLGFENFCICMVFTNIILLLDHHLLEKEGIAFVLTSMMASSEARLCAGFVTQYSFETYYYMWRSAYAKILNFESS